MNASYHERMERGTPDFPIEFYSVNSSHPRYIMQMHWHKELEIIRVIRGSFELALGGRQMRISEGQSVFIPSGIIHGGTPNDCEYECAVFSPSMLYGSQICRVQVKALMQSAAVYENDSNINLLFEGVKRKKRGYELETYGRLYLIAADITAADDRESRGLPNDKLEKIKPAMQMIEEEYDTKISLAALADACRLSPNYFSRYFKEVVGQTPFEYITVYRVEAACEMFAYSENSVTDVCYACGFNDLSYFIHIFKKYKGVSPKAYRTKCRQLDCRRQD